jgi:hypothetical protein
MAQQGGETERQTEMPLWEEEKKTQIIFRSFGSLFLTKPTYFIIIAIYT